MSEPCCLTPKEIDALRREQLAAEEEDLEQGVWVNETSDSVDQLPRHDLAFAEQWLMKERPIWLSAESEDDPPANDKRPGASRHHLLRDALAQLARVVIGEMGWPVVVRWDPIITPILLDGARRFGPGHRTVGVFVTDDDLLTKDGLLLADWSRGKVITGLSDNQHRRSFLANGPLRGMLFMGQGPTLEQDAHAVSSNRVLRRFAFGSTGSGSSALLSGAPNLYSGGQAVPSQDLERAGSYLQLLRDIASTL